MWNGNNGNNGNGPRTPDSKKIKKGDLPCPNAPKKAKYSDETQIQQAHKFPCGQISFVFTKIDKEIENGSDYSDNSNGSDVEYDLDGDVVMQENHPVERILQF